MQPFITCYGYCPKNGIIDDNFLENVVIQREKSKRGHLEFSNIEYWVEWKSVTDMPRPNWFGVIAGVRDGGEDTYGECMQIIEGILDEHIDQETKVTIEW